MTITKEYINECLIYNPDNGSLTWRERPIHHFNDTEKQTAEHAHKSWNSRLAGKETKVKSKSVTGKTYFLITIGNKKYKAHRIIWMMVHGEWPDKIDHINGNGIDNRISNLRNSTIEENSRNVRRCSSNKSGVTGVSWNKRREIWEAYITLKNKHKFLGYFTNKIDAIITRKMAEYSNGFHANHGSDRPL